jgi:hypothetical protein
MANLSLDSLSGGMLTLGTTLLNGGEEATGRYGAPPKSRQLDGYNTFGERGTS